MSDNRPPNEQPSTPRREIIRPDTDPDRIRRKEAERAAQEKQAAAARPQQHSTSSGNRRRKSKRKRSKIELLGAAIVLIWTYFINFCKEKIGALTGHKPAASEEGTSGRQRRADSRKTNLKALLVVVCIAIVLVIILSACISGAVKRSNAAKQQEALSAAATEMTSQLAAQQKAEAESGKQEILAQASVIAAGYDYDGAIELIQTIDGYENDSDCQNAIQDYEDIKDTLVKVDLSTVTHIFYHSLVVDPELAFGGTDSLTAGFKQWMTTVSEFNKITQTMYDEGYVLINLTDLYTETTDADGTVHITANDIYLPEGKKLFVLSLDDLSYYHSYDNHGIASKLVLDENGKPTCEYIQQDGTVVTGAYDCVPLIDAFMEEHPDGAYHGDRGTIALTGYDGVLGYRTDSLYNTIDGLEADQLEWLDAHPDFDYEQECEDAKEVADALKADGWNFASHTWGHIHIGDVSLERLQTDTERWKANVEPIVGSTDIIIFAHGQDLVTGSTQYSMDNAKYAYLKEQGYNVFCNVDSHAYTLNIQDSYVRDGRRNLDGYRLWNDAHGNSHWTEDLFDAADILDPARTDMPDL